MASRRSSIGAQLHLDKRGFKAALEDAKRDASAWKSGVEAMKLSKGALTGEGVGIGKWTELNSKLQVVGGGLRTVGGAAIQAGKSIFGAEASFEKIVQGLAATSDGSETLREELEALKEVAKMPGLGFSEAIEGAAALKGAKLSAVEAREALMALGNALAISGKGKAELDDVIQALNSIVSQGVVAKDQTDILATRIRGFSSMTSQIPKDDALQWVKSMLKALKEMPQATETAKDKVDNMMDSVSQFSHDNRFVKFLTSSTGVLSENIGAMMKKDLTSNLKDMVNPESYTGTALKVDNAMGDLADKYQPTKAELERRKKVRDDLAKAEQRQKDLAEQKAKDDAEALAKAKKAEAEAAAEAKLAATQPLRDAAMGDLAVLRLRAGGQNKKADELERQQAMDKRKKELMDAKMPEEQAAAVAREESDLRRSMSRGRRVTYKGESPTGFQGLAANRELKRRYDLKTLNEEWAFPGLASYKAMQGKNVNKAQEEARAASKANAAAADPVSKAITYFGDEMLKYQKMTADLLQALAPLPVTKLP